MRKIAIITGTRADFGHLLPVIQALKSRTEHFQLQIIVTGSHLLEQHGRTANAITKAGIEIDDTVDILLASNSPRGVAKAMGLATLGFTESFERLQPDAIMVLGDRFELLAACQVALVMNIPILHIHGGEVTTGAFDDSIRHSITKMSTLHFVAAEPYRRRVIQLGEAPETVHNVGAPGLDHLKTLDWLSKEELAQDLGIEFSSQIFVMTYHPVTRDPDAGIAELEPVLDALNQFPKATVIMTHANADNSGDKITHRLEAFMREAPKQRLLVASLGQLRYLSLIRLADLVIGNSSSGLIEVPALRKPTVNIGERQGGRLRAPSVIDTPGNEPYIVKAIHKALSSEMGATLQTMTALYGEGEAGEAIAKILEGPWPTGHKTFFDLQVATETG